MISHWDEMTEFNNEMMGCSLKGAPLKPRVMHASRMCNGLFMEVAELQDSFSWKLNRDMHRKELPTVDKANLAREIVDCLFFLHHIGDAFDVLPNDLEATFIEVMANNRRRHIDGDLEEKEDEEQSTDRKFDTINALLMQIIDNKE